MATTKGTTIQENQTMSYTASQTLHGDWSSSVAGRLAGDLTAAAVSASLIAPTVTIIDRYVGMDNSRLGTGR